MFPLSLPNIALAIYSVVTTVTVILLRRKQDEEYKAGRGRKPPFGSYRDLLECIDVLEVNEIRKKALRSRYVEKAATLRIAGEEARTLQTRIDTYNIALSSTITVLTAADIAIQNILGFQYVGLLIAVLSSINTFLLGYSAQNGLKEKWLDNRQASELIESELWMFLTLTDEYVVGSRHDDIVQMAILNAESIIISSTEKQIVAARQRKKNEQKSADGLSVDVDPPDGMESEITIRTTESQPDEDVFNNAPVDSRSQPMASPSAPPDPGFLSRVNKPSAAGRPAASSIPSTVDPRLNGDDIDY